MLARDLGQPNVKVLFRGMSLEQYAEWRAFYAWESRRLTEAANGT